MRVYNTSKEIIMICVGVDKETGSILGKTKKAYVIVPGGWIDIEALGLKTKDESRKDNKQ